MPWSPPEVLYVTQPASTRSDVYSLAATVWHLLVGRSPFEVPGGDNSHYALMKRIRDQPVPDTGRPDVPASLERLLKAGMAKDPGLRPASAMDFARSLQVIEQELRLPRTEIVVAEDLAAPTATDVGGGDQTRMQGPQLLAAQTPSGHTPPTEDLRTRRRLPAVRGVNAPEDATVHRPATSLEHPDLADGRGAHAGRGAGLAGWRWPWWRCWPGPGSGCWPAGCGPRPGRRPAHPSPSRRPIRAPPSAAAGASGDQRRPGRHDRHVQLDLRQPACPPTSSTTSCPRRAAAYRGKEPWLRLTGRAQGTEVCIWVRVHRASGHDASRTFEKGCVA